MYSGKKSLEKAFSVKGMPIELFPGTFSPNVFIVQKGLFAFSIILLMQTCRRRKRSQRKKLVRYEATDLVLTTECWLIFMTIRQ